MLAFYSYFTVLWQKSRQLWRVTKFMEKCQNREGNICMEKKRNTSWGRLFRLLTFKIHFSINASWPWRCKNMTMLSLKVTHFHISTSPCHFLHSVCLPCSRWNISFSCVCFLPQTQSPAFSPSDWSLVILIHQGEITSYWKNGLEFSSSPLRKKLFTFL